MRKVAAVDGDVVVLTLNPARVYAHREICGRMTKNIWKNTVGLSVLSGVGCLLWRTTQNQVPKPEESHGQGSPTWYTFFLRECSVCVCLCLSKRQDREWVFSSVEIRLSARRRSVWMLDAILQFLHCESDFLNFKFDIINFGLDVLHVEDRYR